MKRSLAFLFAASALMLSPAASQAGTPCAGPVQQNCTIEWENETRTCGLYVGSADAFACAEVGEKGHVIVKAL